MSRLAYASLAFVRFLLGGIFLLLSGGPALAQAPAWNAAIVGSLSQLGGGSYAYATATDASGNVLVTGSFSGTIAFGSTRLTSAGGSDIFLAKYLPTTNAWAWAVRAGGRSTDQGNAVAVSGSSIYLTGLINNDLANSQAVAFGTGSPQYGASTNVADDIVVAKYTDTGTTATFGWSQVAGGTGGDSGRGLAVSGSSVYVTGLLINSSTDLNAARFGGSGTALASVVQLGTAPTASSDLFLAKYTDNGATGSLGWVQIAGGAGGDSGVGLAASGSNLYVAGFFTNSRTDANAVRLGGSGTVAGTGLQYGASTVNTSDLLLVKYVDNGPTASVAWSQVGGGTGYEAGTAVAVSGSSVYLAGTIANTNTDANAVRFGGNGTVAGTALQYGASIIANTDVVLARYTDNGPTATLGWTQVAGGTGSDYAGSVAVSGGGVYLLGTFDNNLANGSAVLLGGSGTVAGTVGRAGVGTLTAADLFVARYADNGATATLSWAQVAGSPGEDAAGAVALNGSSVCVVGTVNRGPGIVFGTATGSPLLGTYTNRAVVAQLSAATGTWQAVAAPASGGTSAASAVVADAQGNIFVAGYFMGQLTLGSTVLTSMGNTDLFVAKYMPATSTWAWAISGGGTDDDSAAGLALSGGSVYLTGYFTNSRTNASGVLLGGTGPGSTGTTVNGATTTNRADLLLAKLTDQGSSATLAWTQVGGGTDYDSGAAVAVSGTSVYVTGYITNSIANDSGVVFGSNGTTAGTVQVNGATAAYSVDYFLAKYTDNGPTATLGWTQVGGGTGNDQATGVAASGTSVYLTGSLTNSATNSAGVLLGGTGTTAGTRPQYGASAFQSADILVAKYVDNGPTGSLAWSQVGGGLDYESGVAVAVSGSSVYVAGLLTNNTTDANVVRFGSSGTTPGTRPQYGATAAPSPDMLLVKYTDNGPTGSYGWSQVAGGTKYDYSSAIAVSGSSVYVAGSLANNAVNANGVVFGGSGTTPGTMAQPGVSTTLSTDVLVAKYTDNGPTGSYAWSQVAGGTNFDQGIGIAVSGQQVYVASYVVPVATFGPITLATPTDANITVLGRLLDPTLTPLASRSATAAAPLSLYPNPTGGTRPLLAGATPGTAVQVLDALGRLVLTATADAAGRAALPLPAGLAPGVYVVRSGSQAARLVVE